MDSTPQLCWPWRYGTREPAAALSCLAWWSRADSPMETRIRIALLIGGLPLPTLQHSVGPYELDLSYPAVRIAVEYNGRDHLDPDRALRDLRREAYLIEAGWIVLRFGAYLVLRRPDLVADRVRARLVAAARAAGLPLEALAAA